MQHCQELKSLDVLCGRFAMAVTHVQVKLSRQGNTRPLGMYTAQPEVEGFGRGSEVAQSVDWRERRLGIYLLLQGHAYSILEIDAQLQRLSLHQGN